MAFTSAGPTTADIHGGPPSLAASRDLIRPALRAAVGRLDPRVAEIAGYHLGWLDAEGHPTSASTGKMLRGAMVLLSAWACGAAPRRGVPGAVAVELVHNSPRSAAGCINARRPQWSAAVVSRSGQPQWSAEVALRRIQPGA